MYRQSLIPNPYRCLTGLRVSVASVLVMLGLSAVERAVCAMGQGLLCRAMQAPYEWWLVAAVLAGLAHTVYTVYVDFFRGRYYRELARLQQH